MRIFKQYQFWTCLFVCIGMFIGAYPFYHNVYVSDTHTFICICLNAFSSIIFSAYLYLKWTNCIGQGIKILFLLLIILQGIGHGIFWIMNWASFFFLPLSAIVFILIIVSCFRAKTKRANSNLSS